MRPLAILLTLAACTGGQSAADSEPTGPAVVVEPTSSTAEPGNDTIRLPLSLYVVGDASDSGLGSQRTTADVEAIVGNIAPIWAQADVEFDPVRVLEIEMPEDVLAEIALTGLTDAFFEQAGRTFSGTNGELLTDEEQLVARYSAKGLVDGAR